MIVSEYIEWVDFYFLPGSVHCPSGSDQLVNQC